MRGELGGPIDNISGGDSDQFINISAPGFAASVRVSNLYFERHVRIGRYGRRIVAGTDRLPQLVLPVRHTGPYHAC